MNAHELLTNFPVIQLGATCFSHLPEEQLKELEAHKKPLTFRQGDIISKQGNFAPSVMFVLRGYVKEYIESPSGRNTNLRLVGQGEFIALSGLFNSQPSNYSMMALTDVNLCLFERDYLLQVIKENPSMSFQLVQRYSELENSFFTLLNSHLSKQMHGKVARALLYLDTFNTEHLNIFDYMSRKDLAEFASVSTENAIRVLKSFESEGLVTIKGKEIHLLQREALERICDKG